MENCRQQLDVELLYVVLQKITEIQVLLLYLRVLHISIQRMKLNEIMGRQQQESEFISPRQVCGVP